MRFAVNGGGAECAGFVSDLWHGQALNYKACLLVSEFLIFGIKIECCLNISIELFDIANKKAFIAVFVVFLFSINKRIDSNKSFISSSCQISNGNPNISYLQYIFLSIILFDFKWSILFFRIKTGFESYS